MNTITIFSARIAKDLIQKKYELADISPNKEIGIKTVFHFMFTEDLKTYLKNEYDIVINPHSMISIPNRYT